MRRDRHAAWFLAVLLVLATVSQAGTAGDTSDRLFVLVVPMSTPGPGTIQAFDVGNDGLPVVAESYPSLGSSAALRGSLDLALAMGGRYLYATNSDTRSIAEYRVLADGTLEPIDGTPLPTRDEPHELAVHPTEPILYATESVTRLVVYRIASDGALNELQRFDVDQIRGLEVSADGRFLFAAIMFGADAGVAVLELADDGTVVQRRPSPAGFVVDRPKFVRIDPAGSRVFLLDLDVGLTTFSLDSVGELSVLGQIDWGGFRTELEPTGDGRFLYVGGGYDPWVHGLATDAGSPAVELPGSPFDAVPGGSVMELMAPTGSDRLYRVTRERPSIQTFDVEPDGTLTPVDVYLGPSGALVPVAAVYGAPSVVEVAIDIRPGSDRNPIHPGSGGVIPVALLGRDDVDVTAIDAATIRFGPGEAAPAHGGHVDDVDGDGRDDLVLHFRTRETGIECGAREASLTFRDGAGARYRGTDVVTPVGCR